MEENNIYANTEAAPVHQRINDPNAADSENIYGNEDQICTLKPKKTAHTGAAVFLGLMCLLLSAGLTALVILLTKNNSEWEMKMTQMEMNYTILSSEINSLWTHIKNLTEEKKHLPASNLNSGGLCDTNTERENCWMFGNGFYLMSAEQKTWKESREECLKKGADLVIINGEAKQNFVTSFKRRVWIGLTDEDKEGVWKWVDGKTLESSFWKDKQPDSNQGNTEEDCAEISVPILRWNDISCSQKNYWLCERLLK